MVRASTTLLVTSQVIQHVAALNWKEKCESDREDCSKYCRDYPEVCHAICEADPSIDGCGPSVTPPPKCEVNCCQDETVACKACHACEPPQKWCAKNRKFPGCDEICCDEGCSDSCGMVTVGSIDVTRKCKWRVLDQKHNAYRPVLLEANVEKHCPFAENYGIHLETCRHCAAQHAPCDDTFMACGGCCGTPWHDFLDLGINTHHTCDEIKSYFKLKNTVPIACEEETAENVGTEIGTVEVQLVTPNTTVVVDEGELFSNCSTPIKQLSCDRIPLKMKFECDDCGNKGTADLLNQCCDKCVEWAKSVENGHPGIPANIKPFIYCSGCDATKIEPLDPALAALPHMWFPWGGAINYVDYTEEAADAAVEKYIEDKVCTLLAPNCDAGSTTKPPRRFLASQEETEECLAGEGGTCAAWDNPEIIEVPSSDGDRRLSALPVETPEFEMRAKSEFCLAINTTFYNFSVELHPTATQDPKVAEVLAGNKAFEGMNIETKPLVATQPNEVTPGPEVVGPGPEVTDASFLPAGLCSGLMLAAMVAVAQLQL